MMSFDPSHTATHYDAMAEREAARWQRGPHAAMSYAIHCHHLSERVSRGDRVLDAGCGPGTFTKVLLDIGAHVTCLDLSPVQLAACRVEAPGAYAYELGSITDLGRFEDSAFDVSLALGGPLSYCFERAGDAMAELRRITRPGGLVGISVMNLFGSLHRFFAGVVSLPDDVNGRVITTGDLDRFVNDGHECHMFRVTELRALLAASGLIDIELCAAGWLVPSDDVEAPAPGTDSWNLLFAAELEACRESPGAGTHIIAWGRTPS